MTVPVKIQCGCGQRYTFEVEPVAGRMPSPVACPVCGADGTAVADVVISQSLVAQPTATAPVHGGIPLRVAAPAPSPPAASSPAAVGAPTPAPVAALAAANPFVSVRRGGRCAVFRDATRVAIPAVCVVCGGPAAEFVAYKQDHLPVTLPFVAYLRWTNVKAPYCARHADAFQRRFKILRRAQGILYALVVLALLATVMEPLRVGLGLPPKPGVVSFAVSGTLFAALAATIFIVKPRLYDLFIKYSRRGVRISCRYPQFIEALVRADHETRHPQSVLSKSTGRHLFIHVGR